MIVLVVLVSYIYFVLSFVLFAVIGEFWELGLVKFLSAGCPGKVSMDCAGLQGAVDVFVLKLVRYCT